MASSVYEFIGTKNARLVRFLDAHDNVSGLLMKIVTFLEALSRARRKPLLEMKFDVVVSRDDKQIIIRLGE